MTQLIKKHSLEEQASSLAAYLPGGELFEGAKVDGTNLRKFLKGLSGELVTAEGYFRTIADEYDITTTTLFIDEWEAAVGIPDTCFLGTGTIVERRRDVLAKLVSLGVQTVSDFEDLADLFGIPVNVYQGATRFTINIDFVGVTIEEFTYTFPFTFGNAETALMSCLFDKLKPANCTIVYGTA